MPEQATITETCSCGATFRTAAHYAIDAKAAARDWREQHRHAESAGICGDRSQPAVRGGQEEWMCCVLKAGHDGWHSDGEGHWTHGDREEPALEGVFRRVDDPAELRSAKAREHDDHPDATEEQE